MLQFLPADIKVKNVKMEPSGFYHAVVYIIAYKQGKGGGEDNFCRWNTKIVFSLYRTCKLGDNISNDFQV